LPKKHKPPSDLERASDLQFTAAELKARKLLLKDKLSLHELANILNLSPKATERIVSRLQETHHEITLSSGEFSINTTPVAEKKNRLVIDSRDLFDGKWYRFGVLGDNHLASKYARLDVLRSAYDVYEREGITTVFQTGNILDGECRFNKHDLLTRGGMEPQIEYLLNEWPEKKGMKTRFICGDDHEGWWTQREGINVGKHIQDAFIDAGRSDMEYLGYMERDIELKQSKGSSWIRVLHMGGGSSYAFSYAMQKLVESLQGGEKPAVILAGHLHKFDVCYPREVYAVQTACTQDQTPFMRKQKLQAHVGTLICEFQQCSTGEITRFRTELMPKYDQGFYEKKDKYRRW
jgi:hypothetical protein